MWDWTKNLFSGMKASDILSGGGALLGGIGQYQAAKSAQKAAKRNYDLNLSILQEERARRKQAQDALNSAWANSNFNLNYLKDDEERKNGLV